MAFTANKRYTAVASGDVLLTNDSGVRRVIRGIMLTAANGNANNVDVKVSYGDVVLADHPGVSPGGGVAFPLSYEIRSCEYDITVTCTNPGGTLAVTVYGD